MPSPYRLRGRGSSCGTGTTWATAIQRNYTLWAVGRRRVSRVVWGRLNGKTMVAAGNGLSNRVDHPQTRTPAGSHCRTAEEFFDNASGGRMVGATISAFGTRRSPGAGGQDRRSNSGIAEGNRPGRRGLRHGLGMAAVPAETRGVVSQSGPSGGSDARGGRDASLSVGGGPGPSSAHAPQSHPKGKSKVKGKAAGGEQAQRPFGTRLMPTQAPRRAGTRHASCRAATPQCVTIRCLEISSCSFRRSFDEAHVLGRSGYGHGFDAPGRKRRQAPPPRLRTLSG